MSSPRRRDAVPAPSVEGFEAAYRELQEVVESLERGGLGLDAAVRLYERGMLLADQCEGIVEGAELRITRLSATDPPDSIEVVPSFDGPAF